MFATLLIANRGEIACRIIRSARRLGIRTVAVYSAADAGALHVAMAYEALPIGPAPARESYLDIERIIAAARKSGADAIHPGYGFLSENADFAAACEAADIVFVGPSAAAIRLLGAKAEAKAVMERAGVPVVPGYHGTDQSDARFATEAARLGLPLLVKASAGGGGRGLRVVTDAGDLPPALAAARREAEAAFGDGRLILERYLARPRHVEVQIFADRGGNVVHLFERDCSLQRRHQKLVEETPAPLLAAALRRALLAASVTAAKAGAYVGAGTVEFLVAGEAFHFIEMNTRLQVEHPVTEMITGTDLVEWQLRIAAGQSLPLTQDEIAARGHAIEARLYAEDPARDFLPASGTLVEFRLADADAGLRIETGVRAGDAVGVHYDPLLAKLIAWGEDRASAVRRLAAALAASRVAGVATNRDFLLRLLRTREFAAGKVDTGFIADHRNAALAAAGAAALAAAGFFVVAEEAAAAARAAAGSGDPHSPWARRDGWRIVGAATEELRFRDGASEHVLRVHHDEDTPRVEVEGRMAAALNARGGPGEIAFELDGVRVQATVVRQGPTLTVMTDEATWRLVEHDPLASAANAEDPAGLLTAPMPGTVLAVMVAPGDPVRRGQLLMLLEAMKMEHAITAPADGVVERVHYAAGDRVEEGALLLAFAGTARERGEG